MKEARGGSFPHLGYVAHPSPPGVGGAPLGLVMPGDHLEFDYVYDLPGGVDPAQLGVVAFAQRLGSQRTVVQAGASF